jgi:hypothetical protein
MYLILGHTEKVFDFSSTHIKTSCHEIMIVNLQAA